MIFLLRIASLIFFLVGFSSPTNEKKSHLIGTVPVDSLFNHDVIFYNEYKNYLVDDKINLSEVNDVEVVIMFGTWCHDSKREVPRMIRILESIGTSFESISLIALDMNKNEPESKAKLFNLERTPTFIFFKNGDEIGRIVERPKVSLESDLKEIYKN
ncbi:MAG: thioredoxin family protein [Gammaproteobacteria bacterium]